MNNFSQAGGGAISRAISKLTNIKKSKTKTAGLIREAQELGIFKDMVLESALAAVPAAGDTLIAFLAALGQASLDRKLEQLSRVLLGIDINKELKGTTDEEKADNGAGILELVFPKQWELVRAAFLQEIQNQEIEGKKKVTENTIHVKKREYRSRRPESGMFSGFKEVHLVLHPDGSITWDEGKKKIPVENIEKAFSCSEDTSECAKNRLGFVVVCKDAAHDMKDGEYKQRGSVMKQKLYEFQIIDSGAWRAPLVGKSARAGLAVELLANPDSRGVIVGKDGKNAQVDFSSSGGERSVWTPFAELTASTTSEKVDPTIELEEALSAAGRLEVRNFVDKINEHVKPFTDSNRTSFSVTQSMSPRGEHEWRVGGRSRMSKRRSIQKRNRKKTLKRRSIRKRNRKKTLKRRSIRNG